jgi:nitroreductase
MNEQPWLFVIARTAADRARFASVLNERNQLWATRAPLLFFVLARRHFARNGKDNRFAGFDAGAAWMALALQARLLGLYTHAMAGYNLDRAYEVLNASREEYDILAAVAVGRRADPTILASDMANGETPGGRKHLTDVFVEGGLGG